MGTSRQESKKERLEIIEYKIVFGGTNGLILDSGALKI